MKLVSCARVLTLLWSVKIFWMSTESFASNRTFPLFGALLGLIGLGLDQREILILHTLVRKSAHVFEYGVLSFLLYCSFQNNDARNWNPRAAVTSILISAAYSLTDELHQSFVRGRGPSPFDCVLDTAGAGIAMFALRQASPLIHQTFRKASFNR